jgi:hypothetical protein
MLQSSSLQGLEEDGEREVGEGFRVGHNYYTKKEERSER